MGEFTTIFDRRRRKRLSPNFPVVNFSQSFVLQLISLAGLHSTATITAELAKAFQTDGMLAYVNLVQRREKELNVDVLTHQKWSGAAYVDGILGAIQSGSSGSKSLGEGNTEAGSSQHPSVRLREVFRKGVIR